MKFEVGKKYKHNSGIYLSIICKIKTTMWEDSLLGETHDSQLIAVGETEANAVNYSEISDEEWMSNFS